MQEKGSLLSPPGPRTGGLTFIYIRAFGGEIVSEETRRGLWRGLQWGGLVLLAGGALVHAWVMRSHGLQAWSLAAPAVGAVLYVVGRVGLWCSRH